MNLLLIRDVKAPLFTLGKLIASPHEFFSVEDTVRQVDGLPVSSWKIPGKTAIPTGTYKLAVTFSQRFQKHLPELLDVPGYSGVRIHSGNTAEDTEGCIIIGTGRNKDGVANSRYAVSTLMEILHGQTNVTITIS